MKTAGLILAMGLVSARVLAGGAEDLIALDKAWGSAGGPAEVEAMLSADLIAVDGEGLSGKAEQLEAMTEALDGPYLAGDYKVNFIDGDTAVMVHSAGSGKNAHWSMHVWQKTGGHWQVMATASVKADD